MNESTVTLEWRLLPGGGLHAVDMGVALCGVEPDDLSYVDPQPDTGALGNKCPDCLQQLIRTAP